MMPSSGQREPDRVLQGSSTVGRDKQNLENLSSTQRENGSVEGDRALHPPADIPTESSSTVQPTGAEADAEINGAAPASASEFFKAKRASFSGEASASFIAGRRSSVEKRGSDTVGDAAIVEKLSNIPIHVRGRAEAWEIPRSQLQLSTKLGAGAGSVVFKCRWRGLDCAAKLLSDRNARDTGVYQEMVNEISIISHLRHPNLVLFLGACTVGSEPLVILSEYMAGGSLEDRFKAIASGSTHRSCCCPVLSPSPASARSARQ